jgi:hypothetical protein
VSAVFEGAPRWLAQGEPDTKENIVFTKIRLILITAASGIVLAVPAVAAAATAPEAKRFHGIEPAAKRFHEVPAGYRGWSVGPNAKRFHAIRIAGGRSGP